MKHIHDQNSDLLKNLSDLMEETVIYGDSDLDETEPVIEATYNINVSDNDTMFSDNEAVKKQ